MSPMGSLLLLTSLALLCLLFVALCIIAVLAYRYSALKSRSEAWLRQEYHHQIEIAQRQAQEQLQRWREQEIELVRQQAAEIAHREAMIQFEHWQKEYATHIRQDAIHRSQSVTRGKITEHIIPYLPGFKYNPKDARFIGSPIDLIVFNGLSEGEVAEIVFIEIKTGVSSLSNRERRVREAIQARRIKWEEIRPAPAAQPASADQAMSGAYPRE